MAKGRAMALVSGANAALFAGILAWIAGQYLLHPTPVEHVRVPATYEPAAPPAARAGPAPARVDDPAGASADLAQQHALHRAASELFARGNVDTAVAIIAQAIESSPDDRVLHNDLGIYRLAQGRPEDAIAAFQQALAVDATYARAWFNLGTTYMRLGRLELAIRALERAVAVQAYYDEARYNLALALGRQGDDARARVEYEFLIANDRSGTSVKAMYNLALLHQREGRPQAAYNLLTKALHRQPDHRLARFNRALVLAEMGRGEEAAREYEKLLHVEPDHAGALLNLGIYRRRQGEYAEAVEYLRRAAERKGGDAQAENQLGLCYLQMEAVDDARQAFRRAIELEPDYADARHSLGTVYLSLNELEEAAAQFARAVELKADRADYHYDLGRAYAGLAKHRDAIAAYTAVLKLEPAHFKARYNLGMAFYDMRDYKHALPAFEQARTLRPDSYKAAYNVGLTLLKLGQDAEAEEALRAALALQETTAVRYNLGLALERRGETQAALEEFQGALRIDPRHRKSLHRLARLHAARGDHKRALRRVKQLQQLAPASPVAYNLGIEAYRAREFAAALPYFQVGATGAGVVRHKCINMVGLTYGRMRQFTEAVEHYRAVQAEFPDDWRMRANFAWCLGEAGDRAGALAELSAVVAAAPQNAQALFLTGAQYAALGDAAAAEEWYHRAVEIDPSHESAQAALQTLAERAAEAPLADADEEAPEEPNDAVAPVAAEELAEF